VTDPTQDYSFQTPPDPTIPSGTFPGCVQGKLGADSTNTDVVNYHVNVYTNGLGNKPTLMVVGQLQIDKQDVIPSGTWTEVTIVAGNDPNTGPFQEKTMQVPVWLQ
jgi:hypothetical protein